MKPPVAAALLLLIACSTPIPIHFGPHQRKGGVVAFSNPRLSDGDPIAGRRAFVESGCIDCHRVDGDPGLPRGPRAAAGPLLSNLGSASADDVAGRITSRSTGSGEDLFGSEMEDYTERLTARKLVDIVAYLRSRRAGV